MTQKERLLKLILNSPFPKDISQFSKLSAIECDIYCSDIESFVDYLLSNGVIVPPCKAGDTVYLIGWFDATVKEEKILYLTYDSRLNNLVFETAMCLFDANQIGKFVFLNREAAEQALKERNT